MKQQADKHWLEREFQVGDSVYLRLQPYRQTSINVRAFRKLSSKFYGPYKVLERIRHVAYRLDLPEGAKIHPVFHVSLLKKRVGDTIVAQSQLPDILLNGELKIQPQTMLERRMVKRGNRAVTEILVQWTNASRRCYMGILSVVTRKISGVCCWSTLRTRLD
ncbi:uncharacterized protein LOC143876893 [Tasmannia lanceolata]|uniref:uncharacterized protein LOC143876893 n=1 Tax=Tasmannia lanceolata TaxID=3420 RepID=UPI0040642E3B